MFWDEHLGQDRFSLALITGSTSGIGLALCQLLADQGINLILHGRDANKLKALAQILSDRVEVQTFLADLSIPDDQIRVANFIAVHKPDLLINNAGIGLYGEAIKHTTEAQLRILEIDGQAVIRFSIEAARALINNGLKGVIMNVSSVAGFMIFPNLTLYSSTKALVNHFSESFDEETKPYGVRILAACPGVVATNFRASAGGKSGTSLSDTEAMTANYAAQEIWKQILNGKKLHIFNWKYRFAAFLARYVLPKAFVAKLMKKNIERIQS